MEVIHASPTHSQFSSLSEHQSRTPSSFYSGPPILYHHSPGATLLIHASELDASPTLSALAIGAQRTSNGTAAPAAFNGIGNGNGGAEESAEGGGTDEEIEIRGIEVWVTSEYAYPSFLPMPHGLKYPQHILIVTTILRRFILYSHPQATGLSIPYPTITLHAIQRPASRRPSLFLQLLTSPAPVFDDHDPDSTISLTLVPAPNTAAQPAEPPAAAPDTTRSIGSEDADALPSRPDHQEDGISNLYTALTACANLHPDPLSNSEGDENDDELGGAVLQLESDADISNIYPLNHSTSGDGTATGLPPPMPGSGGWITAETVGEFFDENGNWRGRGGELGEGAGTTRGRDDGVGGIDDGVMDGSGEEEEEETKWRRTE